MNRFNVDISDAQIEYALRKDGYAIIENVLDVDGLKILNDQIKPYLVMGVADSLNPFMGEHTVRFGRLLYRIPKTREMAVHPKINAALHILTDNFPTRQLHFTGVMHVMGGAKAQVLHRDTVLFTNPSPPTVVATMWAAQDFTRQNGATVFVPGSHLWPESRVPLRSELACAEMPAGSVLLYLGNLIHGAGRCQPDCERTGVSLQYSVGWMRQEENQYLATPIEIARTFSEDVQRLMGYDLAARHWGYVDQQHPLDFLHRTNHHGGLNPQGYDFHGVYHGLIAAVDSSSVPPSCYYDVCLDE